MTKKIKKNKKDEEKNKYHKEYGVFSNLRYILRNMSKYDSGIIVLFVLRAIAYPIAAYLWTFIAKFVIDMITEKAAVSELVKLMAVVFLVQLFATILQSFVNARDWWRLINIRLLMMNEKNHKVMTVKYEYLEDSDIMDCYQKASQACNNNNQGIEGMMHQIEYVLSDVCIVAVGLAIMGTLSVPVMLAMTALALINFFIQNKTNKYAKEKVWDPLAPYWRKHWYMTSTISDFSFAKDIRLYGMKGFLGKKLKELHAERIMYQRKNGKIWWLCGIAGNFLWLISQCGLYAWLVYSIIKGNMTIGNFSMYLGSAATFFQYIMSLLNNANDILARSREVDDFRSFMDIDADDASGKPVPEFDSYEFKFEGVSFKYPKSDTYALKNLNLTLKAGERLAVVGLNGAGKSTFIKLLLRLYDPTEGKIYLNGIDISEFDRQKYYKLFAPVFQDVNLFAFPLSMNVSMSSSEITNEEKARRSLIEAGLSEKLDTLKDGMKTEVLKVIYDDGVDFSGGEKQKLALARALYKDSPVIVLDEPTAALDALAEAKLYEDFDKLIKGKTSVYISHRLSSTQFCSHVAMFKDGQMLEHGTHESLLALGGAYSEMFNVQAQYYLENGEGGNEAYE